MLSSNNCPAPFWPKRFSCTRCASIFIYLRLQSISYAIDAGWNSITEVPYGLEYKKRIVDGDLDGNATVDMGAFEHYPYGLYLPVILE
jgi:hypothetical protein